MLENKNTDPKSEDNEKESLSNNTTSKPTVENTNTSEEDNQDVNESLKEEVKTAEKKEEKEVVDYTKLSLEDLVSSLKAVIASNEVQHIKSEVEAIKSAFNKKFGALLSEKKKAFLEAGGNSIDFHFSSPIKTEYNSLLSDYKTRRDAFYAEQEKILNQNLENRLATIEALKHLIENAESTTMYKEFRKIQDRWKKIGAVPKARYNDTWKIYHHHVERFYDLLHLSNDLRDLDFKHNLEEKLKLIEQAEALSAEEDVNVAAKELQKLHKAWKEDIGPVAREMREEVWQKFSDATKKIHDKRHDFFKQMRSKFQDIVDKKMNVIQRLDAYDTSNNKTHNDWQQSINVVEALRQEYFDAGKLPFSKSESIWQKFKNATKKFNSKKNAFYKGEKDVQQDNLKKKIALVEIAESLKDSEDWETTTNTMKKIQSDWKKIGHVPRKFSDDIWKRFKAACNHYFDRLNDRRNTVSEEEQAVVDAKKEFLDNLKKEKVTTKEAVLSLMDVWKNLGRTPRKMRYLEERFSKEVDNMLNKLSLSDIDKSMLKFTSTVDGYLANEDIRKLDSEQQFVRKKIDEVNREIQQLENNLGFFSNADDNNPLLKNVNANIEQYKKDLQIWEQKLNYLKNLDY